MKKMITIMAISAIIYFIYPKKEPIKKVNFTTFKEFGIITHEDIYTDSIDLTLYSSHGRLKYNVKDN